jgi:uncharacterized membrane protein
LVTTVKPIIDKKAIYFFYLTKFWEKITAKFLLAAILVLDEMELKLLNWAREKRSDESFTVRDAMKGTGIPYSTAGR